VHDGALLQQATDSALEGLLAYAECVANRVRARAVANPRCVRTTECGEDRVRVVGQLLVGMLAERQLDPSVAQDVGHPEPRRLTARERVRLGSGDEPDERSLHDDEEPDLGVVPPGFPLYPLVLS